MKQNSVKPKGATNKNAKRLAASKPKPKKDGVLTNSKSKQSKSFSDFIILNQEIIDASPIGTLIYQAESGICVYANPAIAKITGGTIEQLCKLNFRKIVSWKKSGILPAAEKAIRTSKIQIIETDSKSAFGKHFWVRAVLKSFFNNGEKFLLAHITDISERKRNELNLESQMKKYRMLMATSQDAIHIIDKKGNLIEWNDAFLKHLGYTKTQAPKLNVADWDIQYSKREIEKKIKSTDEKGIVFDTLHQCKNGDIKNVAIRFHKLNIEGKELYYGSARDITERKVNEQKILTSEDRYYSLVSNLHIGVMVQGPNAEIIVTNNRALELLGLTEDQLLGKTSFDKTWNVIHEDGSPFPGPTHPVPVCIATRKPIRNVVMGVYRPTTKDRVWLLVNVDPQFKKDGTIKEVICTFKDFTDTKNAQISLSDSKEKYRSLFENMQEGFAYCRMIYDKNNEAVDFIYLDVNDQFGKIVGVKNAIGKKVTELIPGIKKEDNEIFSIYDSVLKTGIPKFFEFEVKAIEKCFNVAVYRTSPEHFVATFYDITPQKKSEANLKLKEESISKSLSGIGMTDLSGNIIYANESLLKMWGCKSMNELIGKNLTTVFSGDRVYKTIDALKTKGFDSGEDIGKRMDGSLFDVEFSANIIMDDHGKPQCMFGSFIDISEKKKAEKALQQSEILFREITDHSPSGIVLLGQDLTYKFASKTSEKLTGYNKDDIIGLNPNKHIYPNDLPELINKLLHMLEIPGHIFTAQYRFLKKDGTYFWIESTFTNLLHVKGVEAIVINFQDINERKILENELRQSEEDYRKLFENHSAIKYILEPETGKIIDANYAAAKFYGWSREELKKMNIRQINVNKTDEQLRNDLKETHRLNKYNIQVKHQLADGSVRDMEILGNSVIMGGKSYIHSIIIDITDRKLAEAKIREKDLEFRKLSDNVPDLIFQFSRRIDGTYFVPIASSGIKNIFGCNPEDVVDDFTPIGKVLHPDDAERVLRDIEYSAKNLSYFTCEFRVQIPGKEIQWIYSKSTPEKLDDGTITWYGFNSDITNLKKAEERLLKINRLYEFISQVNYLVLRAQSIENLYHEICDIAIIYGKFYMSWIGLINDKNDSVNAVAWSGHEDGYLKNAFIVSSTNTSSGNGPIGKTIREGKTFVSDDIENDPSMAPWRDNALKRGYRSSISIPIKVREKVIGVFVIYSNEKNFFSSKEEIELLEKVTQNISFAINNIQTSEENKIAEKQIIESEEKYRLLIHTMNEGLLSVDNDDVIQYANNRMFQITGYTPSELVGKVAFKIFVDEEQKNLFKEKHNLRLEKKSDTYEIQLRKKNGELIWVSISGTPILDSAGNVVGSIGVHSDISERKAAEKHNKNITDDLIKRNKDLEQFTYIVSHNLRSPVANIKGFNEVLKTVELEQKDKDEMLNGIFTSVSKLDDVIQDLNHILQVKQIINEKKEKISFAELVNDIKLFMGLKIGENEVIIKSDFSEIDEMFTLKSYINSVFYNLISNSIKYRRINEDAVIDISSKKVDNKIFITFRDNGLGIDLVRNSNKIFGLYKRFHSHTEGKGMGLFMVKTQVETLGGKISVKSEVGKGTEFLIELDL